MAHSSQFQRNLAYIFPGITNHREGIVTLLKGLRKRRHFTFPVVVAQLCFWSEQRNGCINWHRWTQFVALHFVRHGDVKKRLSLCWYCIFCWCHLGFYRRSLISAERVSIWYSFLKVSGTFFVFAAALVGPSCPHGSVGGAFASSRRLWRDLLAPTPVPVGTSCPLGGFGGTFASPRRR